MPIRSRNKGFTLLELLVALTIFALISVAMHGSLISMIETRQHLENYSNSLRELQTAFRIIGRDIEQSVNRPIRTRYLAEIPAMLWTENPGNLELTINGRRNPVRLKRSSLQRVAYRLEEDQLIKDVWPVLDRDIDTDPFSQVILAGVSSFAVSFVGTDEQVSSSWPPEVSGSAPVVSKLPRAVHIFLELKGWGEVDRLFLIN